MYACMHTQVDGWVGRWMNRWRVGRMREGQGFPQARYGPLSHLKQACLGCLPPPHTWEMILQELQPFLLLQTEHWSVRGKGGS